MKSPDLSKWLAPLDELPLECDGMTRVISALLFREGIAHRACYGTLRLPQVGSIPLHYWIQFPDATVCDYRARMWLGPDAPHGLFRPESDTWYEVRGEIEQPVPPLVFRILAGVAIEDYPPLLRRS